MKKNLLLVHLESLNLIMYRMNRHMFPFLSEIEKNCFFFVKYFSTATSTIMVISDLFYGGLNQYEQCDSLACTLQEYVYESSLFDDLKQIGYYTEAFFYPGDRDTGDAQKRNMVGFHSNMVLKQDEKEYVLELEKAMENRPFALLACNYISNLAHPVGTRLNSGVDDWKYGFEAVEQNIKDLFAYLKKEKLMDSTTIVFYGDHGDEYWTHGMHKGLAHATEPYAPLIHTPLFIWDSGLQQGYSERLIDTTDIRKLLYRVLAEGMEINQAVEMVHRKYSLSRNAYVAQPLRKDSFSKAYSITDGKYLMMVSNEGLSLFDIEMDPTCHNNFLRFFVLENNLIKENDVVINQNSFHFRGFMNIREIRLLRQKFYYMRAVLYQEVAKLYIAGNRTVESMASEMNFNKINY